ncbi:hypothetical protein BU15DRAFT_62958 [Melanogaster broomeanus]|nr:hypothetical protein BU15DRAFT_62958 [Melanogaster broomeanus]
MTKVPCEGGQELAPINSDRQLGRRKGQPSTTTTREEDNSPVRGAHKSGHPSTVTDDWDDLRGSHRRWAPIDKSPMRGADKSWHPSTVTDNWDDVRGSHRRRQRERRTTVLCEGPTRVGTHRQDDWDDVVQVDLANAQ